MITVEEIEKAVQGLPEKELYSFRAWFDEYASSLWERNFEQDVQSGKLDALADEAIKDMKANRCTRL